ncbi:hypothetical protein LI014_02625 [Clostridium perfringens]|uniref:hypothetical protein n=1 Tax=Clostridium perfringens TaxID=1502 RepID=UPI002245F53E|nr:hypothetical protein [Clostridium perfringens]MCX0396280.1 hypothetical protein [Clostridium perfringens]
MDIWNKSYNQDWLEMSENLKEDEVVLLVPTKVKFDKNGMIKNNRTGSTFDNYKRDIQKLELERMMKECKEH